MKELFLMKRFSMLGLVLIAVLASFAVTAASASAFELPKLLGEKGELFKTFTGTNDEANPKFETVGGDSITCKAATATGAIEASDTLGLFHITFTGCESEITKTKTPCNSLSDAKEVILMLGLWHNVVDSDPGSPLTAAIVLLPEDTHINCGLVLLTLKGDIECLWLEPLSAKVSHLFHCIQEKGKQDHKTFLDEKGEKLVAVSPGLTLTICGGKAVEAGLLMLFLVEVEGKKPWLIDD
jgi:hypothetical protein